MHHAAVKAIGVAGAAALISIGVYASSNHRDAKPDAAALANASVTLAQAVTVAEKHAAGRAAKAEFELTRDGRPVYDVEVISGARTWDVRVDATTTSVLSATEDQPDADVEHDHER